VTPAAPPTTAQQQRPWTLDPAVEQWMVTDYHAGINAQSPSAKAIEVVLEHDGGSDPAVQQLIVGNAVAAERKVISLPPFHAVHWIQASATGANRRVDNGGIEPSSSQRWVLR
jgi:hypothetical protein